MNSLSSRRKRTGSWCCHAAPSSSTIHTSCSKRSGGSANRTLRFSPSAKYLYDCVREVLREVVSITKTLVHANAWSRGSHVLTATLRLQGDGWGGWTSQTQWQGEVYTGALRGMAGLVDEYLSNLVETMRNSPLVSALEPRQRFAMVLNAFFLAGARQLELFSCTHTVRVQTTCSRAS